MYRLIRNTHLLMGLFSAAFIFMYGISSVQFAHQWFNVRPAAEERAVTISGGANGARAVARELIEREGLSGELVQVRQKETGFAFRLNRVGTSYEVDYSSADGATKIRTLTPGVMGMMVRFHHVNGLWHELTWTNVAAGFLAAVSFFLILLGLSGIYLWFKLHKERRIGVVLLAVNLVYSLTLMILIRMA